MTGDPIPLSVLELDLPAPATGWGAHLASRGIEITADDIGRLSITRAAARELITEHLEDQVRRREAAAAAERQAIEADQRMRAQLWGGLPASAVPDGVLPVQMMAQALRDERPRRESLLDHALANPGGIVYHPIREEHDE